MTYGQVAKIADTYPQVVGFAMHGNKDMKTVPCHRVVALDGSMRGYVSGISEKERKLREEGVKFLENGKVNLQTCLFISL